MKEFTKKAFVAMLANMGKTYGVAVEDIANHFNVSIPMATKLLGAIQESVAFLGMVSVFGQAEKKGQVINITGSSSIASNTDTSGGAVRKGVIMGSPEGRSYECQKSNFDVAIRYELMDQWGHLPNFAQLMQQFIRRRRALDLLLIGWYGTEYKPTSNRVANPLLQDVNTGWIHDLKTNGGENYITTGTVTAGKIKIGSGGDYVTLDQAVSDLLKGIPMEHRTGNEVALVGSELLGYRDGKLYAANQNPQQNVAAGQMSTAKIASVDHYTPAGFPAKGLIVTDPQNLQIYVQSESIRRAVKDEPKADQVEDYQSQNSAWRIGDLKAITGLDHTKVELV